MVVCVVKANPDNKLAYINVICTSAYLNIAYYEAGTCLSCNGK